MPETFEIGSKVEMLRCYKNLQSIPTRIHHDGVPHKAVACFYRESRVIRLCVLALLIGLAEAAFIPVYPRSSPCLPEREPTSLSLSLSLSRYGVQTGTLYRDVSPSRQMARNFCSFHKCRVPFLEIENSVILL